jgi:hypothetical protein
MRTSTFPIVPFTASDLSSAGVSRTRLRTAVQAGDVRRVLRGVYVRADLEDSVDLRAACAARVIAPGSVIVDRSAAWIHGVDVFVHSEHEVLPEVESCVRRWRARTRRAGIDGRSRDLTDRDVMTVNGVRVTTPLRTALDLGCNLTRRDALAALDQFMRLHELSHEELGQGALRYFRRRGVIQLRELIPLADRLSESPRESWTRLEIVDQGLPMPVLQFWIEIDGVPTYRLDLAYPKHRIAVEYDGDEHHLRTQEQRRHDAERRQWLRDHGWTVIVVRNGDFTGAGLERWIHELRSALRATYSNRRW